MESGQQRSNLAKLRDSDLPLKENWQEVLGLVVYDITGEQIGSVEDLYVNRDSRQQRFLVEPRFLVVSAGGLLEVGKKHFLIPVEKISREVVKNRVRVCSETISTYLYSVVHEYSVSVTSRNKAKCRE